MKESEPTTVPEQESSRSPVSDQIQDPSCAPAPHPRGSSPLRHRESAMDWVRRTQGTQSAPGPAPFPKLHPTAATCTPRQRELQMDLPPCRRHSRIRELRSLAAQLGAAIDRTATFDTDGLAEWEIFELMLREALIQLGRQRVRALARKAETLRSDPQTSRPL
jgi:hypothetical protein